MQQHVLIHAVNMLQITYSKRGLTADKMADLHKWHLMWPQQGEIDYILSVQADNSFKRCIRLTQITNTNEIEYCKDFI